ncbi:hypothetical protein D3C75_817810 [compost metagenome]
MHTFVSGGAFHQERQPELLVLPGAELGLYRDGLRPCPGGTGGPEGSGGSRNCHRLRLFTVDQFGLLYPTDYSGKRGGGPGGAAGIQLPAGELDFRSGSAGIRPHGLIDPADRLSYVSCGIRGQSAKVDADASRDLLPHLCGDANVGCVSGRKRRQCRRLCPDGLVHLFCACYGLGCAAFPAAVEG